MEASRHASPSPACDEVRSLASLALDDALDEVGRRLLARHLSECPACAAFAAEIGSVTALLRGAPLEPYRGQPMSGDVFGSHQRRHFSQWITMASAVAVVVVAVGSLPNDTPPSGDDTSRAASAPVKLPIGQRSAASDFAAPRSARDA